MIGNLNINSLRGKFDEVHEWIEAFDILSIQETKIDRSFPDSQFAITGYNMYRRDRKKGGGGILVYVRKSLPAILSFKNQNQRGQHGQITPHRKKESVLDKKNFRPVTVLPAFAKVFEKIIHMQMTEHFESIFHDYMFAYRQFHGCPAALLTLTEDWRAELDKRKVIGAVAIDLSKAFDYLPHELLLEKLKFYGVPIRWHSYEVTYHADINELSWAIPSPPGWVCRQQCHRGPYLDHCCLIFS